MTLKRAVQIALRELTDQVECMDDLPASTRKDLTAAVAKLKQFLKLVYGEDAR